MPETRTRLHIRRLDTIGFVDKGDDPKAEIVFFKRAETFDEVGSQEKINSEIWDLTHRISRSIMSALEESEDDQSPIDIINTSIDQFSATVRARAPMWVQGKPVVEKLSHGIIERGEKFLVMSEDGTRVLGTHDTKEEAETQLAAVEANTNKGRSVMDQIKKFLSAMGRRVGMPQDEVDKLLAESASGSDDDTGATKGGDMPFDIEKLGVEERAEFEKLQGQLAEAAEKLAGLEKAAAANDDGDSEGGDVLKDVPEPVAKLFADMTKRVEKAEERAQKLEDASENAHFIRKSAEIGLVPDDHADILRKISGVLEDDEFKSFTQKLTAMSKQAAEGGLYGEIGTSGQMNGDEAEGEIGELVKTYRADNPGTTEELARGMIYKSRPDLRRAVQRNERTSSNTED